MEQVLIRTRKIALQSCYEYIHVYNNAKRIFRDQKQYVNTLSIPYYFECYEYFSKWDKNFEALLSAAENYMISKKSLEFPDDVGFHFGELRSGRLSHPLGEDCALSLPNEDPMTTGVIL